MSEDFSPYSNEDLEELKKRFFQMKEDGSKAYFDVDEYESLIDYFFEEDETDFIEMTIEYALDQHPGNYIFLLKKAQLYALYGNDEKGLEILDQLTSIGSDTDYFMVKGSLLSNLQKYREAIEEYTKALNNGEDLEEVYTNIAFEYENLEQFDKAIEYLDKVIELNPHNEAALNEVGLCFEMSNQSEKSLTYFNEKIDQEPYSRAAWFNLAIAYNSLNKNKKAIEAYKFSLAIDEDQPSALFNIANIYASMEEHEKALKYYRETLLQESPDALTHYYMGESYEKLEDFDKALICFEKSHELNKDFHESLIGISRSHFLIGNTEKALQYISKAAELPEPFPLFWSIRIMKLDERGFYPLAEKIAKQLIKTNPEDHINVINLALLHRVYNLSLATQLLQDALLKFTDDKAQALLLFLKGLYEMQNNKFEIGYKEFELGIQIHKEEVNNPLIQAELTQFSHPLVDRLLELHKLK
ncbi:MAG: hypothetical protein B7C24_00920 [Bacteroidetes bacterium 4572_77]|nr:MAG: hypothetical protein B7C24_00920 [Bacteroidetes bacterium 4572_77]